MSVYQETYKLPSMGLLNDEGSDFTIRNMTTTEEKLLLGSSPNVLDKIISDCIVKPENLDLGNLLASDKHYILMKLRIISYGLDYFQTNQCNTCGSFTEYKINLEDLDVHYLPEDFEEPYDTFTLPISKQSVSLKLPRVRDLDKAEADAKKYKKKYPESAGDISYVYRLMANIHSVDGETLSNKDLQKFVEGSHATDTSYIKHRMSKIKIGLDTEVLEVCSNCGADVEFAMTINADFFRTRFDD